MPVIPARPPCRNLVPLAARLSYGALWHGAWLPSLMVPAENPPASATGAAERGLGVTGSPGVGSWCCTAGNLVCYMAQEGKALTWELAAPSWALQTELQLGEMMCWSCSAPGLQDPPGLGAEARSCLPAVPGTHVGPCKPPEVQ